MQYFYSPRNRPQHDSVGEAILNQLGEPAPVNARLAPKSGSKGNYEVHAANDGPHGIGFLTAFKAGALHTIHLEIRAGNAQLVVTR